MTVSDLLARCNALGVEISADADGNLAWSADADPPAELLTALGEHKAEVLALLGVPDAGCPVWVLPPGSKGKMEGSCPGCRFCSARKGD